MSFTGVLEPGYIYGLAATASGSRANPGLAIRSQEIAQTTTEVTFTLRAVPEPAAAGVLALGAGLVLRRRRV